MSGLVAQVTADVGALHLEVSLATTPGTLVVVGPNGAGKSTLLSVVLGARTPRAGKVEVDGAVLLDTARGLDVPLEERGLGYVPQHYALFPHLTVRQNVAFGQVPDERVEALLRELGLESLADRRPHALSGGERQRVALARALSIKPRALLLDEPLSALDVHARREVREFLARWLAQQALPTVVVTHDAEDARALGHRILVLEAGRVTQAGTWDELVDAPKSAFVREFFAGVQGRSTV